LESIAKKGEKSEGAAGCAFGAPHAAPSDFSPFFATLSKIRQINLSIFQIRGFK